MQQDILVVIQLKLKIRCCDKNPNVVIFLIFLGVTQIGSIDKVFKIIDLTSNSVRILFFIMLFKPWRI